MKSRELAFDVAARWCGLVELRKIQPISIRQEVLRGQSYPEGVMKRGRILCRLQWDAGSLTQIKGTFLTSGREDGHYGQTEAVTTRTKKQEVMILEQCV